ncbi:MAG TPA: hypothetical protein VF784_16515, partial [Anaerolineales bacterium]
MKIRAHRTIHVPRVPVLFALVTVLAYGLLLPLTGFFWDDWPFAWLAKFLGPAEFIPAFRGFRPFLGPIFLITTTLVPPNPLLWQILALVIRFLSALTAWFALKQVWPQHPRQTLVVSLLFLVFPGYSQNWVALTHINQEWIPLIFYLLSFAFSTRLLRPNSPRTDAGSKPDEAEAAPPAKGAVSAIWASLRSRLPRVRVPGSVLSTLLALLFLIAGLFPTEYFFGLEPLRFLFIWVIVSEATAGFMPRLRETLKHWWPYLVIW